MVAHCDHLVASLPNNPMNSVGDSVNQEKSEKLTDIAFA